MLQTCREPSAGLQQPLARKEGAVQGEHGATCSRRGPGLIEHDGDQESLSIHDCAQIWFLGAYVHIAVRRARMLQPDTACYASVRTVSDRNAMAEAADNARCSKCLEQTAGLLGAPVATKRDKLAAP